MPRTRSTKEVDKRSPAEKLIYIRSDIDKFIFFQYYDGMISEGLLGFDPKHGFGSAHHTKGVRLLDHLTTGQFRGKGQKMGQLAKEFVDNNLVPAGEHRARFDSAASIQQLVLDINQKIQAKRDTRTPQEKLAAIKNPVQIFIFYQYYGLSTHPFFRKS
jgi:hypothetical protein